MTNVDQSGAHDESGDWLSSATAEEISRAAASHGMHRVGTRPLLGGYIRDLWERRGFLWTFSVAKSRANNAEQKLGQFWNVANPLLLIITYFLIFGLLLGTDRGVSNFIAFLSIGVILFSFSASTLTSGSRIIHTNTGLVRALQFPRAILPLSSVLIQTLVILPGLVVLLVILPVTGQTPMWKWLLFPFAFLLQVMMQTGLVLILARIVHSNIDVWNLIPVAVRLARYVSGVFFSIGAMTEGHPVIGSILEFQPLSLQLTLARQTLLSEFELNSTHWIVAAVWAIVLPIFGLCFFWRDEAKYGRS